ncbi:hypothetical protein T07_2537 [Trichinella nelsoni]|uniref:Uncharacterized protein n=1 Tax=Trichinella nelsoni TaxID=6336 RepID=A0A0V0SCU0_9BILA|nr:hypothetical protein T07_2537 [Trichinella nelsoni]
MSLLFQEMLFLYKFRRHIFHKNSITAFTQLNPHPGGKFYILRSYTFRYRFHVDLRHPRS